MTDTTDPQAAAEPLRIPIAHSVRYAARGLPEVPFLYGPGAIRPSEITLTYRAAPDSQLGRVHAYVKGRLWVDEREVPTTDGYGQHYDDGLDEWPEWLAEEARLHDPDAAPSAPADRSGMRERIAGVIHEDLTQHKVRRDLGLLGIVPRLTDAVLSVLPPAADRAAVLREAADAVAADTEIHIRYGSATDYANRHANLLRRLAAGERDEQQAQQDGAETGDGQGGELIEDYLRFLRGQGPEPDLTDLAPADREVIAGRFEIVRALADRDPSLPPLDLDPVARRLGLHADAPADEEQQAETQARGPWGTVPGCNCPHPADEHSIYGCADGCGCEWMPKRPPMDPVHILGIEADEPAAAPVAGQPPADTGEEAES